MSLKWFTLTLVLLLVCIGFLWSKGLEPSASTFIIAIMLSAFIGYVEGQPKSTNQPTNTNQGDQA